MESAKWRKKTLLINFIAILGGSVSKDPDLLGKSFRSESLVYLYLTVILLHLVKNAGSIKNVPDNPGEKLQICRKELFKKSGSESLVYFYLTVILHCLHLINGCRIRSKTE